MKTAGVTDDVDTLIADTLTREESGSTALPQGVAIPHCRTSAVAHPVIAFASLSKQVLFDGSQNPVDLVFLIVVPLDAKRAHLKILSTLARALINQSAEASLRAATTPTQVEAIISASLDSKTAMRKIMHRVLLQGLRQQPHVLLGSPIPIWQRMHLPRPRKHVATPHC